MTYELTEHAVKMISERKLSREWIERALSFPEAIENDAADPALTHRLVTIPEYGNRILRVIVKDECFPPRVITAFFDRSMKGKL